MTKLPAIEVVNSKNMDLSTIEDDAMLIYIGRGSVWGNPFKIGIHGNREKVIALYHK